MVIKQYDIEHYARFPWQTVEGSNVYLRLKCNEKVQQITVAYGDPFWFASQEEKIPVLTRTVLTEKLCIFGDVFYQISLLMHTHKLRYHFEILLDDGQLVYCSEEGITEPVEEGEIRPFVIPYVFQMEHSMPPKWAEDFTWYQIFPDRFSKNGLTVQNFVPDRTNFFGGTLEGIRRKIPYLKKMGVQGIYLNPIFESNSNHRYDTTDYKKVDQKLGTEQNLSLLIHDLHRNGLKVMLDGVFNHCGWNHPFWQDVLLHGSNSSYYQWFYIHDLKTLQSAQLSSFSDSYMKEKNPFEAFAFAANMPKWNTENRDVIEYLCSVAEYWTKEYGIDAWRLDVPDEISWEFLSAFKKRMKLLNSDIYIIGEIWQDPMQWLQCGLFDGVMDYRLYFAIRDFAMTGKDTIETFARRIYLWYLSIPDNMKPYQWEFCSNHDVPRVLTECGGNPERVKLACFLAVILGGNFSVYYGDELGLQGGADPLNRGAMDWDAGSNEMQQFFSSLLMLKRDVLKNSKIIRIEIDHFISVSLHAEKRMTAIITSPDTSVEINCNANTHLIFGEGRKLDNNKILVHNFALFVSEE